MAQGDLITDINLETRRVSTLFLGFAAAAVGFAVHEVSSWGPTWALIPVGLAGASWGGSFFCGIEWVHAQQGAMGANVALNRMNEAHPKYAEAKTKWESSARSSRRLYRLQMYGLLAGAVLFAIGQGARIQSSSPIDLSNVRRCAAIQDDMLRAQPRRTDSVALFTALGCRPQGEGSVHAVGERPIRKLTKAAHAPNI